MRLRFTVAYHGGDFSGWQSQADGDTVQDTLEKAFATISRTPIVVYGAGRTDAGVHALAQCAHADVPDNSLPPDRWLRALNSHLPQGVRVMTASAARPGFHARFSAKGKIYRYSIWNNPSMLPTERDRAWHVPHAVDPALLRLACQAFVGTHDFAAFSANRRNDPRSTVREITAIQISHRGPRITLTFHGTGFLYKMVRMLTAAAIRCGTARFDLADLRSRLASGTPRWNIVAPAEGLCLVRVRY